MYAIPVPHEIEYATRDRGFEHVQRALGRVDGRDDGRRHEAEDAYYDALHRILVPVFRLVVAVRAPERYLDAGRNGRHVDLQHPGDQVVPYPQRRVAHWVFPTILLVASIKNMRTDQLKCIILPNVSRSIAPLIKYLISPSLGLYDLSCTYGHAIHAQPTEVQRNERMSLEEFSNISIRNISTFDIACAIEGQFHITLSRQRRSPENTQPTPRRSSSARD